MLRVLFFASIRERLGHASLSLEPSAECSSVQDLIRRLDAQEIPGCAALLEADNTLIAVNREVVGAQYALADGDEIAFYPPVTGG